MKKALEEADILDYLVVELTNREDCEEIQNYLETRTGGRTVSLAYSKNNLVLNSLSTIYTVLYIYRGECKKDFI